MVYTGFVAAQFLLKNKSKAVKTRETDFSYYIKCYKTRLDFSHDLIKLAGPTVFNSANVPKAELKAHVVPDLTLLSTFL